ncbi:hypothetical protein O181_014731 [Austropuccinia psidii MF-1]|uniref:Uncharacterized protein n=1 Tax=Austropuccinia psidii MF-1 TaxID=1389203 RepID=A0A9Q3GPE5_9BASI|nr:hypothetical protein [Austropuccinia psidii MF-1]
MANLQAASVPESSRPPDFKTPSMKAPECFDGTQAFKARTFIQSFQLIFHNDPETFSQDRKKVLYSTSFLIGRAAKLIYPCLSNLTNQDPNYLLNSWSLFESQISPYLGTQMKSLVSRIGDWGERALIHDFRKGLPSRILDQLASHPSRTDSLYDLMDVTLELDTRYHERKKEKIYHQEKKPEASKTSSSHPQNSSSSSQKKKKNFQKRDKPHSSLLNNDLKQWLTTLNSDHRDYYDPSKSFRNGFSSSKSCAALVGDSRTPSFPSSVHIASLNSHQSLLSSREEVFKEIQDVGEYNPVSSLNLLFGNMDLPPSSSDDSLEELWDKEKEPE